MAQVPDDAQDPTPVVTPRLLRRLAGERAFGLGEAYLADGAVRSLRKLGGGVKAVVQGTRSYRVRLSIEQGDLEYDCTCPVGEDGVFCKHCVAVALAWHADEEHGEAGSRCDARAAPTEEDVREYLLELRKEELVSILLDQANADERLHRKLMVRVAQSTQGTAAPSVWKQALDEALASRGFVSYHEAYDYASDVEDVIDGLGDLLREGQAASVIDLAEHGLARVEESSSTSTIPTA